VRPFVERTKEAERAVLVDLAWTAECLQLTAHASSAAAVVVG
jgi:hypothetical protein